MSMTSEQEEALRLLDEAAQRVRAGERIEANSVLVKRGDGWTFRIDFDNGACVGLDEVFKTQAEAYARGKAWLQALGVTEFMTAQ